MQQYAAAQGYTNLRTYSDIGFSGLDMNRPAFMQMEQDIRDGMIDKIIIRDLSRIGRNYAQVMRWLDGLADIGVVLHTKLPEYADVAATMPIKRKGQLNPTTTPHKNKYPGYRER